MPSPFTYVDVTSVTPLQRYSDFATLLYAKNYFYIYIYIYKYKEYFRGWDREKFYCNAVTL